MLKFQLVYLTICSLTQGVYISRMTPVNRVRGPTPFRPGPSLQMPWMQTSLVQAASNRAPYVVYRHPPNRYAVKHYPGGPNRNIFGNGPWKTTGRLPPPKSPSTPEYEFVKAASTQPAVHTHGGTGGIHTIPAPNLSLSEKPIVVMDASESSSPGQLKTAYEVTEKYQDSDYNIMPKIKTPIGFSKATSLSSPELQTLIRNGAAPQYASEFGLPINVPQPHVAQQYPLQGFNGLPTQQDLANTGAEGIFIPPNPFMQSDPMFFYKLHNQLLQRFPAVEFIPYQPDVVPHIQNQMHFESQATQNYPQVIMQPQTSHNHHEIELNIQEQLNHPQGSLQAQESQNQPQMILQAQASQNHPQVIIVEEHVKNKQAPQLNEQNTVIVQRETQHNNSVTLVPQTFVISNVTEIQDETTLLPQQTSTSELVTAKTEPVTTTINYIMESSTEEQNTTPIYYAQVGQRIGNVIANGFYSAINDVRAAAALAQVERPEESKVIANVTTTTLTPDMKAYFVQTDRTSENKTSELKPLLGVPFKKSESVNVAYTLLRTDDIDPKMTKEGAVYAGQIVEATISEDQDFNKEKANLISKRAPIRLLAVSDINNIPEEVTMPIEKVTVVKAKIPPKSKLTFDDKTGEPILRIYASYVDNPLQRDAVITKLATLKQTKESPPTKEMPDNWKGYTVKSVDKTQGFEANQVTQSGLKLKSRSDDYIPLFEDYEY